VFSCGPDGLPQTTNRSGSSDDIVMSYMPQGFFITRADYVDANFNNRVDFSDYVELTFSRPATMTEPLVYDFETEYPERALGSALVRSDENPFKAKIEFAPPDAPSVVPGQTRLYPREFIESIRDFSPTPRVLQRVDNLVIDKRR